MAENNSPECLSRVNGDQDTYKMSAKTRGFCCLFLNQTFYKQTDEKIDKYFRKGADIDIKSLYDEFKNLKFDVKQFNDYNEGEIIQYLDMFLSKKTELKGHDAFVAIFSSHGNASKIYDKYLNTILIDEIMQKFRSDKCPELANKPKILIFLCCRGGERLDAMKIPVDQQISDINWDAGISDKDELVAAYQNIIICYSTAYNYLSSLFPDEGTIYGKFLAKNLNIYSKDKDLEYILRKCAQDMSKEKVTFGGRSQKLMPSVKSIGWEKMLYFNPGYPRD